MQLEYLKAAGLPLKTKRKSFICTDHFEPSEVDLRNQRAVASKTRPSIRLEWNEDDLRQRTGEMVNTFVPCGAIPRYCR